MRAPYSEESLKRWVEEQVPDLFTPVVHYSTHEHQTGQRADKMREYRARERESRRTDRDREQDRD